MNDAPTHNADAEGTDEPTDRGKIRWVLIAVVALVAVGGGIWFAISWGNRGAEEASVEDALEAARGGSEAQAALLQPGTGVYTYSSEGSEQLSLLGTGQDWGATIPSSVTVVEGGCWEHRMDFSTNHWASQVFCPEDGRLMEQSGVVFQSFDFVATRIDEEQIFTCEPPSATIDLNASPGDGWPSGCDGESPARGTSTRSEGVNEFLGEETIVIDGEDVPALRYRLDRTISGDQNGTNEVEHWYHAESGLLLKGVRNVEVASPSPVGDIVYSESGAFEITSLVPQS